MHEVQATLAPYGYSVNDDFRIVTPTVITTAKVSFTKAGRTQVRSGGRLLWSGPAQDIAGFIEHYWFAKRLPS